MRPNRFMGIIFSAVVLVALAGCGSEASSPNAETTVERERSTNGDSATSGDDADAGGTETTIPSGARAGSDSFPFPVPEDWIEIDPFTEGKIGGSMGMSASYEFVGDAETTATSYEDLLRTAGFVIHPNPLGAAVNDASFIVEGTVNGDKYKGTIDFSTIADGTPRAAINLQQD